MPAPFFFESAFISPSPYASLRLRSFISAMKPPPLAEFQMFFAAHCFHAAMLAMFRASHDTLVFFIATAARRSAVSFAAGEHIEEG